MLAPPFDVGACQFTVACKLPALAVTLCGWLGGVAGVTALEDAGVALSPNALVATTLKM